MKCDAAIVVVVRNDAVSKNAFVILQKVRGFCYAKCTLGSGELNYRAV